MIGYVVCKHTGDWEDHFKENLFFTKNGEMANQYINERNKEVKRLCKKLEGMGWEKEEKYLSKYAKFPELKECNGLGEIRTWSWSVDEVEVKK